ncbi:MAG: bifunctional protein-disulfide isomerase/oxidoreductase DsbC [Thiohalomonadaceae bacterium]
MPRNIFVCFLALLFVSAPLHAEDAVLARLRAVAAELMPGQQADSITPSPVAGLYQIAYGPRLFYISADGRHLISGDVFDLQQDANLTEEWRSKARVAALDSNQDSMILYPAKGKAKHTLTVFTDVDCTYCRKMHSGIKEMNDLGITVRYLAFPRAGIPSSSYDKLASVWCAADRNKAMDLAKNENKVDYNVCADNPVAQHLALGRSFGVNATPTLVLDDGTVIPGYLPPERLAQELDRLRQARR